VLFAVLILIQLIVVIKVVIKVILLLPNKATVVLLGYNYCLCIGKPGNWKVKLKIKPVIIWNFTWSI